MKRILNNRPAPSMIVALVALFVAMGGVSYAAATIGTAQIKDNSVRSKDLRNDDIRGKDVRTGTLGGTDVKDNALTGKDVLESSLGSVPRASEAGHSKTADHANTANHADKAGYAGAAGNADTVGSVPASALQRKVRWVQVNGDDGSIVAQSGGITVTYGGEGYYFVDFGTDTTNGLIDASGAQMGSGNNAFVNAQRCGGAPLGVVCGAPHNTPSRVLVQTDDPDDPTLNDADFYAALVQ